MASDRSAVTPSAGPAAFVQLLGGFPVSGPPDLQVLERQSAVRHTRLLLEYTGADVRVPAFLLLPEGYEHGHGTDVDGGPARYPAAVAIHQDGGRTTRAIGKSEPAGLLGDADQSYGAELCRRGFVVLCPDRPGVEAREHEPHPPGTVGVLAELRRAVDVLLAQPGVDPERVGVIGHSAGGWLATMLAFIEPRVRAVAVSSGVWLWRWSLLPPEERPPRYNVPRPPVPGLGAELDQDDFLAGIAPRPYLHTQGDPPPEPWRSAWEDELTRKARARYAALGTADRFAWETYESGGRHGLPEHARLRSYAWLDRWLVPSGG